MRTLSTCVAALGCSLVLCGAVFAEVTAERSERGVVVKIDGAVFTEYLTKAGQSPALWPVIGPTGEEMTRAWPLRKPRKGETTTEDHPHHQSIWFTHDKVSGVNFWEGNVNRKDNRSDSSPQSPAPSPQAHIAHREFVEVKDGGDTARVVTRNDWMNGNKRVCEDERTLVFGTRPNGDRWIDFTIVLKATDADVTFGDTKEGTFAVRVPDPMRVEAKRGGKITNSDGFTDDAAWGLPAKWVDYTGPVAASLRDASSRLGETRSQEILGIAIMSHPKSFRPTPRWHVRAYGLFAANPFGKSDFPNPEASEQGPTTIEKGDSLTLRYRVLLHRGPTDKAEIDAAFAEFARE